MNLYLDTIISIIAVIIVFSIVVYVIQELIAANLQYRGKMLRQSLTAFLDGKAGTTVCAAVYDHPQIKKLQENVSTLPSYVPAANFALALMDIIASKAPGVHSNLFEDYKKGIAAFVSANGDLGKLLRNFSDTSTSGAELQSNIEKWYNNYMDRVTGWYKRKSRVITRILSVGIVLLFNINLISITQEILDNTALRDGLVKSAESLIDNQQSTQLRWQPIDSVIRSSIDQHKEQDSVIIKDSVIRNYFKNRLQESRELISQIKIQKLPMGWDANWKAQFMGYRWLIVFAGWLTAAVALSMGAPFWFDLLLRLVNLRRAGLKPSSHPDSQQ